MMIRIDAHGGYSSQITDIEGLFFMAQLGIVNLIRQDDGLSVLDKGESAFPSNVRSMAPLFEAASWSPIASSQTANLVFITSPPLNLTLPLRVLS